MIPALIFVSFAVVMLGTALAVWLAQRSAPPPDKPEWVELPKVRIERVEDAKARRIHQVDPPN